MIAYADTSTNNHYDFLGRDLMHNVNIQVDKGNINMAALDGDINMFANNVT